MGVEKLLFAKYCRQEHQQPSKRTCSLPRCLYMVRSCPSLLALWGGSHSVEGSSPSHVAGLTTAFTFENFTFESPCPEGGGSGSLHPPAKNPVREPCGHRGGRSPRLRPRSLAAVKHCETRDIPAWHYGLRDLHGCSWGARRGGDVGRAQRAKRGRGHPSLVAARHMPQFPHTHPLHCTQLTLSVAAQTSFPWCTNLFIPWAVAVHLVAGPAPDPAAPVV